MEPLVIIVLGLLTITGLSILAQKLHVASPLLLVVAGVLISLIPTVPDIAINPELILAGILPPLLYSSATLIPTIDFRRDLTAITGLSVVLVVITSVILGVFFNWVIPGINIWWGIALGAILSPTDAIATSIAKNAGISGRTITILEGEGLLNDATALVLLRGAIASTAVAMDFWDFTGQFFYSLGVAGIIGVLVGVLSMKLRSMIPNPTISTVFSITVPFLASIPSEYFDASGLVAAVIAGLVVSQSAMHFLSPQTRVSDAQVWGSISLILEGGIFLLMGLEFAGLYHHLRSSEQGVGFALLMSVSALGLILIIRAIFCIPLGSGLKAREDRSKALEPRLQELKDTVEQRVEQRIESADEHELDEITHRAEKMRRRINRKIADTGYMLTKPMGLRETGVIIWSGMRGAVTVAAAQTLPLDAPHRSLLVFIAFTVAGLSLLIQGSTLSLLIKWIKPAQPTHAEIQAGRDFISSELGAVTSKVLENRDFPRPERNHPGREEMSKADKQKFRTSTNEIHLEILMKQRERLLELRRVGAVDSEALQIALHDLDSEQISLELKRNLLAGEPT